MSIEAGDNQNHNDAKKKEYHHDHEEEREERLRVLIVNGATTIFALTKFIAEAFGWRSAAKAYDPQPSKGTVPPGSHWTVERKVQVGGEEEEGEEEVATEETEMATMAGIIGAQKSVHKAAGRGAPFFHEKKIKVFQLFHNRGDVLVYRCDDNHLVTVILDGVERTPSYGNRNARFTPKCVGADTISLSKNAWTHLNNQFLGNRRDSTLLVLGPCTQRELEDAAANRYKIPLFDNRGNVLEGVPGSIAEMQRLVALPFLD